MFISYVLSFVFVGIYWNNHHHLFQAVRVVNGRVLWANLLLLFSLSLLPFGTAWMGEHEFAPVPVAVYGVILLGAAMAYYVLVRALCGHSPTTRHWPGRSAETRRASCRRFCTRWRSRSRSWRRWWRSGSTCSWR